MEMFQEKHLPPGKDALILHHFRLESGDLTRLRATLSARGLVPTAIRPGGDHSLRFRIQDPNGLALEFHQYTEQSARRTGQDVEVDW